ncbi:BgTH12-07546 [Blumeria graminis f. sp. triticale]|uniref:BgtASP-21288 n=3 Tax=Blumeria graminis TaxID=34373 RepID=A0A9X9LA38_BLUGR|nr:hypothetical protein BGT96224_ASP21288 [Blumeria graminis f. sp. tritici 96224]CAD6500369.1 BgTH12-07546 [Blumeria graminis f. sp. triticale]VCU40622.1 BgtASP-21288 [Blumeria graminis f. sp. tritici]
MAIASTILLVFPTILLPPVGVGMVSGCGADLLINIILTVLGYFPGLIHAFYLEYNHYEQRENSQLGCHPAASMPGNFIRQDPNGGFVHFSVLIPIAGSVQNSGPNNDRPSNACPGYDTTTDSEYIIWD